MNPTQHLTPRPALVGREDLVAALDKQLDAVGVRALHVRGPAGAGRSRTCADAASAADAAGRRVLRLAGIEAERSLPYAAAYDLALGLDCGESARRHLGSPDAALALADLLVDHLAATPTTLVIDDVQWLDDLSAAVLHRVVRLSSAVEDADLVVVTAGDSASAHDPWHDEPVQPLPRLDDTEVAHLVASLTELPLRPRSLRRVVALAEGSPRTVVELVAALDVHGDLPALPESVRERHLAELASAHPGARHLLLLAAMAEDRDLTRLAGVAGIGVGEARALLAVPVRLGQVSLTSSVQLRSPQLAEVLAATPDSELHDVRRSLLPSAGPVETLRHRAHLAEGPDPGLGAELLDLARDDAASARLDRALELARLAGTVTEGDLAVESLLVEATTLLGLGRVDHASQVLAGVAPRSARHRARAAAAEFVVAYELHPESCAAALREAQLLAADFPDLSVELAAWEVLLAGSDLDPARMVAGAERALRHATASADPRVLLLARGVGLVAATFNGDAPDLTAFERAAAASPPVHVTHPVLDPHFAWTTCLWARGDVDAVRRLATERATLALDAGDLCYGAHQVVLAYLAARISGLSADVSPLLDAVERRARDHGNDTADTIALFLAYARALDRGDEPARMLLEPAVLGTALAGTATERTLLSLFGEPIIDGWLATGRAEDAVALLGGHVEHIAVSDVREPTLLIPVVAAVEAAVLVGQLDRAAQWLELVLSHPRHGERPQLLSQTLRTRAMLLAARGEVEQALTDARSARDVAASAGLRLHAARARWSEGHVLRGARRRLEAAAAWDEAAAEFAELGMALWHDRSVHDRSRLGLDSGDGSMLSASQRRVVERAALGATNAEIATALGVSSRTVESHLAAAYRKLGIQRRSQLAATLRSLEVR
ncbi:MAG: hypothetical protein F2667_09935 [Actinobacteria bacterium]|uniref:Unannotated protein n=1 Tax=freshwater metagenome TaxID=449393 RepID=A0A6J6R785_9ZZZZ|nr:hypothetical protein [Actinomycetota bacterium]